MQIIFIVFVLAVHYTSRVYINTFSFIRRIQKSRLKPKFKYQTRKYTPAHTHNTARMVRMTVGYLILYLAALVHIKWQFLSSFTLWISCSGVLFLLKQKICIANTLREIINTRYKNHRHSMQQTLLYAC